MTLVTFGSAAASQHLTIDQYFVITSVLLAVSTASMFTITSSVWIAVPRHGEGPVAVVTDRKEVLSTPRGCPQLFERGKGQKA